jgi:predicted small lipoprotein YifL
MKRVTVLIFLALNISACGKKGALIYPEMLVPAAPSNVSLQQRGESLKLSFTIPAKDRAGRALSNLAGVTILKRDAMAGQVAGCSSCTDDYSLFKKLNLDLLPTEAQLRGSLMLLLDGDVRPGRNYSYIVSAATREGVAGAPTAPVTAGVVPPPVPPVVQVISQPTEISLEFVRMPLQEGAFVGYNVYRTVKGGTYSYWPLNRGPVTSDHFTDMGLERSTTYVYAVRMVISLSTGAMVESGLSNEVEGRLKDDE